MNTSKVAGFIIDCRTDDLQAAAKLWDDAPGLPVWRLSAHESEK